MEMPAPASWQPVQSQLGNTRPYPQEKCVDRQGFVVKLSSDSGRFSKDSGRVFGAFCRFSGFCRTTPLESIPLEIEEYPGPALLLVVC